MRILLNPRYERGTTLGKGVCEKGSNGPPRLQERRHLVHKGGMRCATISGEVYRTLRYSPEAFLADTLQDVVRDKHYHPPFQSSRAATVTCRSYSQSKRIVSRLFFETL